MWKFLAMALQAHLSQMLSVIGNSISSQHGLDVLLCATAI